MKGDKRGGERARTRIDLGIGQMSESGGKVGRVGVRRERRRVSVLI